ncbi:MAG: hypothetical protein COT74_14280 [Bdellovibrionales bacterium CG10_big_fil_rev_8_21_14_0_10_45_34]|nr:MAG: hypothetical protein COT74_14280 [Bdellovibrionales bacterium CG10_big_fil_rev_8_21_14_0_10_45_34]
MKIKRRSQKEEKTDLDLMPVISIMAVCICFLLLATVFVKNGALSSKQALGSEFESKADTSLSLWIYVENARAVDVAIHGGVAATGKTERRKISLANLKAFLSDVRSQHSQMTTALLFPSEAAPLASVVRVMDLLKQNEFKDVGVAPL